MGLLTLLPLLMLAGLPIIPESPAWYMRKDRNEGAEAALRKINRSKGEYDPSEDLKILREAVETEREQ
jgi:hypothetical protein